MANVTRYDPFGDLFDDLMTGFFARPIAAEGTFAARRVKREVSEIAEAFKGLAGLPGVKKDAIPVTIDGDEASIFAEMRKEEDGKEGERVVLNECRHGKVSRAFRLGREIDQAAAQAK